MQVQLSTLIAGRGVGDGSGVVSVAEGPVGWGRSWTVRLATRSVVGRLVWMLDRMEEVVNLMG